MSNFENACFIACDDWVNEIDSNIKPDYSKEHIKRIKEISKGGGNARFGGKKLYILLVAAIVLLLNVTAFATVKSKQLSFCYSNSPYQFGVENPVYKSVDNVEYGYLPEGFTEVYRKYNFQGILACMDINSPECEVKFSNGEQFFFLYKTFEASRHSYNPEYKTITRFEDNGINYIFIGLTEEHKDSDRYKPSLYWNNDGYTYFLTGYDKSTSCEEMLKIARDVK